MKQFKIISGLAAIAGAGVLLIAAHPTRVFAQSNTMSAAHPDFSGFWEVIPASRRNMTPAKLTQQAIARDKHAAEQRAEGKVVVYASRWCNYMGMPFIMAQSPPINLVQTPGEL